MQLTNNPQISVIVPVFNAAEFLADCINSIISQTFKDFELIIINDGSKDKSLEICKAFAEKDNRISIFDISNKGVSHARNLGIKNAKGKWITFIDSDDTINKSLFEIAMNDKNKDADIIFCGYNCVENNKIIKTNYLEDTIYLKKDFNKAFSDSNIAYWGYPWGRFFRSDIIKNKKILFDESLSISEDRLFFYNYIIHIGSIALISTNGYNYRINRNGLSYKKYNTELYKRRMILLTKASYIIKDVLQLSTKGFAKFWYFNIYYLYCYIEANLQNVYNPYKRIRIYKKALNRYFDYDFYNSVKTENKDLLNISFFIGNKKHLYLAKQQILMIEFSNFIDYIKKSIVNIKH